MSYGPSQKPLSKYDIAREFRHGFVCAVQVSQVPALTSDHWVSGWKAGRDAMYERLNKYLESIGFEKMGVVTVAEKKA